MVINYQVLVSYFTGNDGDVALSIQIRVVCLRDYRWSARNGVISRDCPQNNVPGPPCPVGYHVHLVNEMVKLLFLALQGFRLPRDIACQQFQRNLFWRIPIFSFIFQFLGFRAYMVLIKA